MRFENSQASKEGKERITMQEVLSRLLHLRREVSHKDPEIGELLGKISSIEERLNLGHISIEQALREIDNLQAQISPDKNFLLDKIEEIKNGLDEEDFGKISQLSALEKDLLEDSVTPRNALLKLKEILK